MKNRNINQLVDKFMNGDTSLEEEKQLYGFFSANDGDAEEPELKPYFTALGQVRIADGELKHSKRRLWPKIAAVAATVIVAVIIGIGIDRNRNYCEAFVYGEHVTNKTMVMNDVARTLDHIGGDPQMSVDNQLKDMFGD